MHKIRRNLIISSFLLICSFFIFLIRSHETYEISMLLNKLSSGMQVRQILAAYFLFCIGYLQLRYIKIQWGKWGQIALSYLYGTALWAVLSIFYLCTGIRYNFRYMMIGSAAVIILSFLLDNKNIKLDLKGFIYDSILFIGIAAIASTGLMFTFSSGDSQYYIQEWGKGIAILERINHTQRTFLLHTGILPATFSSLAYFFNADNIYTIHHCLEICFWIFFYKCIDESVLQYTKYNTCIRKFISICLLLFTYMLPPIRLMSGWIISNMYMMIYMFIFCYSLYRMLEKDKMSRIDAIFIHCIVVTITLLRSDASITICTILGCFAIYYSKEANKLFQFLVSAFIAYIGYYMKIYTTLQKDINGTFISHKTLLLMGGCFVLVGVYMLLSKYLLSMFSEKYIYRLLYGILFVFNIVLLILFQNMYFENIYTILKNTILVNEHWGSTLGIVFVCLLYINSNKNKKDIFFIIGICLIVIYIDFGVLRTINGTSQVARLGFGDSMNRSIISVLPMLLFCFYKKYFSTIAMVYKRNEPKGEYD